MVIDDPAALEMGPGTRLRVGAEVVVEVGGVWGAAGQGPGGLQVIRAEARSAMSVVARVVAGGVVHVGDAVRLEAVSVPLEDVLDLHSFQPEEITAVVVEYLEHAQAAGLDEVRIVHGRGRGVQRESVRRLLGASPLVARFGDAPPERGGWGATVVRLRPAAG